MPLSTTRKEGVKEGFPVSPASRDSRVEVRYRLKVFPSLTTINIRKESALCRVSRALNQFRKAAPNSAVTTAGLRLASKSILIPGNPQRDRLIEVCYRILLINARNHSYTSNTILISISFIT